ncbi:MAG: hypothetical protein M3143_07850 [Actinomycetota bacterium]|nr:hypothetical protein [Actinomycetota bacterium]
MDKDMHPGHEPEHVDLTQLEGEPGARVDPLFERQTDNAEFAGRWFRVRFYSDTPIHSAAGTATALLKLVFAASLPAAGMAAAAWAMGAAAWLTLTSAALMFMVVGGIGLLLILRIVASPGTQHELSSDNGAGQGDEADPRLTDHGQTRKRHSRHQTEHPNPTRPHRALHPPKRR